MNNVYNSKRVCVACDYREHLLVNRQNKTMAAAFLSLFLSLVLGVPATAQAANRVASVERVGEDIRYLASDELEGRGPKTEGLEKAANYIRDRFENLGLEGHGEDGSFSRSFDIKVDTSVVQAKTSLVLRGPEG